MIAVIDSFVFDQAMLTTLLAQGRSGSGTASAAMLGSCLGRGAQNDLISASTNSFTLGGPSMLSSLSAEVTARNDDNARTVYTDVVAVPADCRLGSEAAYLHIQLPADVVWFPTLAGAFAHRLVNGGYAPLSGLAIVDTEQRTVTVLSRKTSADLHAAKSTAISEACSRIVARVSQAFSAFVTYIKEHEKSDTLVRDVRGRLSCTVDTVFEHDRYDAVVGKLANHGRDDMLLPVAFMSAVLAGLENGTLHVDTEQTSSLVIHTTSLRLVELRHLPVLFAGLVDVDGNEVVPFSVRTTDSTWAPLVVETPVRSFREIDGREAETALVTSWLLEHIGNKMADIVSSSTETVHVDDKQVLRNRLWDALDARTAMTAVAAVEALNRATMKLDRVTVALSSLGSHFSNVVGGL